MLGKKHYQPKLFTNFNLASRVDSNNFYRRLKNVLDLHFLYKQTELYYGKCGQKSIDPIVFFKICLVGYLENIISDRKLVEHCSMRLDILFFLDYDIDDEFVWHSTISRTRQLFPENVFESVFNKIFTMCVDKGMVSGHTQTVDSALIKANASMDSLELKVPEESLEEHLKKVRVMSSADRTVKNNKASFEQRKITASDKQLKELKTTQNKWSKEQDQRPGAGNKGSKYTSNKTHYSPTDPDARVSVKPGKARKLNYLSQLAVDTANHVISHIHADFADKKDNQCLEAVVNPLKKRLAELGLTWKNIAADAGYSSGENYAMLERNRINSYIPPHGTYKGGPENFTYNENGDYWICPQGKKVTYRKTGFEKDTKKKYYYTRRSDCKGCLIKAACIGNSFEKKISITYYKDHYNRAIQRVNSKEGRYMKNKRQATVEPVFGALINHLGMRKINTLGIRQANKNMLMAAMAHNLKKYLKFERKIAENMVKEAKNFCLGIIGEIWLILSSTVLLNFSRLNTTFRSTEILRNDDIGLLTKQNTSCATGTINIRNAGRFSKFEN